MAKEVLTILNSAVTFLKLSASILNSFWTPIWSDSIGVSISPTIISTWLFITVIGSIGLEGLNWADSKVLAPFSVPSSKAKPSFAVSTTL